jgi:next-to-BRCA1 protein 1
MASPAPATGETLVTLKVNYDGNTRRFKLPLRELGASSLEPKVCSFLVIQSRSASAMHHQGVSF